MTKQEEKIPDWEGKKHLSWDVRFFIPGLYGKPVYYTDGTKIPYVIEVPKLELLTAEDISEN